jgi:16S rRNA (cytosine967-C5)-methyltransferase
MIPAAHPSGRGLAAEILTAWEAGRHTASELLDLHLKEAASRGQVTDLVFGVIRHRGLLDHVLTAVAAVKIPHTEKDLLILLRLGVYELLFCPDTAEYAVLSDLADPAGKNKKRRGFINGVLRSVQRAIEDRKSPAEGADLRRWVACRPPGGCLFKEPLFPDPQTSPADYYSTVFSIPQWLIEIWLKACGSDGVRQICLGSGRTPAIILQPNMLKTNAVRLAEILKSEAVLAELNADKTMLKIHTHRYLTDLWAFQNGFFLVQDPSAAKVVALMELRMGSTVLDLCAAPGGKTMQIAMAMHDQGKVIATDTDSRRLQKVEENRLRLGITCVRCVPTEGIKEALGSKNKVQSVLLDVPCSNTGVMARRAEVRWRLRPETIPQLVKTQKDLLDQAAGFVRKHGTLIYSTCSILPEENENLVKEFLLAHDAFSLEKEELTLPFCGSEGTFAHDGGYVAVLRKG